MKKKIKKILMDISKKNVFFRKLFRKCLLFKNKLSYSIYKKKYSIDDKTILFEAFGGRNYTCSPKAIYEKILTMPEFKDFKFVWAFVEPDKHEIKEDERTIIVKSKSKEYYKYCSIAKYWIVNSIMLEHITKKEGQVYVQCWHGTPLKRLGCDLEHFNNAMNSISEIRKRYNIIIFFNYNIWIISNVINLIKCIISITQSL